MIGLQDPAAASTPRVVTRWLVDRLTAGQRRRRPLPRLADVHPGQPTSGRWVGLREVATECIRGTASMAGSRGGDFRPLGGREPADWQSRWSRLRSSARAQSKLPPIALVRAGGDYWVVDGHNRVALAIELGQRWIDAEVTEVDLGGPR